MTEKALITPDEAEEIVQPKSGPLAWIRNPLLIGLGVSIVIVATLLIMTIMSFWGARTGIEALLPFLDKRDTPALQAPKS